MVCMALADFWKNVEKIGGKAFSYEQLLRGMVAD